MVSCWFALLLVIVLVVFPGCVTSRIGVCYLLVCVSGLCFKFGRLLWYLVVVVVGFGIDGWCLYCGIVWFRLLPLFVCCLLIVLLQLGVFGVIWCFGCSLFGVLFVCACG